MGNRDLSVMQTHDHGMSSDGSSPTGVQDSMIAPAPLPLVAEHPWYASCCVSGWPLVRRYVRWNETGRCDRGHDNCAGDVSARGGRHLRCRASVPDGPAGNAEQGHRSTTAGLDQTAHWADSATHQEPGSGLYP